MKVMKVKELMERLKKFDGELRVVVDGYEGGLSDIVMVRNIQLQIDCHKEIDCFGNHDEMRSKSGKSEAGVYISQYDR